jgi:hypothetical protein
MMPALSPRHLCWSALLLVAACGSNKEESPPVDAEVEHPAPSLDAGGDSTDAVGVIDVAGGDSADAVIDAISVSDSLGQSYACVPPPNGSPSDAAASPATTCVVGQTYCIGTRARGTVGAFAQCQDLPPGCTSNPTCTCVMPVSNVSCSCSDSGGFAILTCDRV